MSTRIILGLVVLAAVAGSANAYLRYELTNVTVTSYSDMVSEIREIVPDGFAAKQEKNLQKAIDRLDGGSIGTMSDLANAIRRSAKPLAQALDGTSYEEPTASAIIGILVALATDLGDIADDLGERIGNWEELAGPYAMTVELSDKRKGKLVRLLGKARLLVNTGGGDDTLDLGSKGKELKLRAGALLQAMKKLQKLERKLQNAGR
jgi:hypothetical protein